MYKYCYCLTPCECYTDTQEGKPNFYNEIQQYEARSSVEGEILFATYGTAEMGLDLSAEAWPRIKHVFSSHNRVTSECPGRPSTLDVSNAH
jgi:hypothetical protein